MHTMNDNISATLQKLTYASSKTDNHDKKIIDISSKHTMMDHQFERKFQANISPSEQGIEKPEEELI